MNLRADLAQIVLKRIEMLKKVDGITNDSIKKDAGLNNLQKKMNKEVAVTTDDVEKICSTYSVRQKWLEGDAGPMFEGEKLKEKQELYKVIMGTEAAHINTISMGDGNSLRNVKAGDCDHLEQIIKDKDKEIAFLRDLLKVSVTGNSK